MFINLKEKISVRGAPDFMKFFNSLDKQSISYKEINEALVFSRKIMQEETKFQEIAGLKNTSKNIKFTLYFVTS